jgi:hypothetical protein
MGEEEKKPLSEEDILKKVHDEKFQGNCFRVDGKKITENQLKNLTKEKDEKQKEEIYDPRKNRLANGIVELINFSEVIMRTFLKELEQL